MSTIRWTLPAGCPAMTWMAPAAPMASTALLARTLPRLKLIVEVTAQPPGVVKVPNPAVAGPTTVTLADTATARVDTPHWPAKSNIRLVPAARAGPPNGPAAVRVSSSRQGATV